MINADKEERDFSEQWRQDLLASNELRHAAIEYLLACVPSALENRAKEGNVLLAHYIPQSLALGVCIRSHEHGG